MGIYDEPWRSERGLKRRLTVALVAISIGILAAWRLSIGSGFHGNVIDGVEEEPLWVDISYVQSEDPGAVCLDGSPPAYHLHRGSGSGSNNWVVFLEGGGWCHNQKSCGRRSRTSLGSSSFMEKMLLFSGILSKSAQSNPDFYNWNRVKVRYCDGASFYGNVNETKSLMFRGQRVWRAVIKELLHQGMDQASKAFLAGCSAGGLATILHCDDFRSLLPKDTFMKCMSDAGFFLDGQDVQGNYSFRSFYKDVYDLQHLQQTLPEACTSKHGSNCLFPQYLIPYVQAPLFILNPGYDTWQIQNILARSWQQQGGGLDPTWETCTQRLPNCEKPQLEKINDFRDALLGALDFVKHKDGWGLFVDSCFAHCQTEHDRTWIHSRVGEKSMKEAIGDWYFDRGPVKLIEDCVYPCNPTCLPWK